MYDSNRREDMGKSGIDFNQGIPDIYDSEEMSGIKNLVKYCRECELACPVGKRTIQ